MLFAPIHHAWGYCWGCFKIECLKERWSIAVFRPLCDSLHPLQFALQGFADFHDLAAGPVLQAVSRSEFAESHGCILTRPSWRTDHAGCASRLCSSSNAMPN
jgi:hypothetical protein